MTNHLPLLHLAIEAALAGLVWLLYRRLNRVRRELAAIEDAHGLLQKKWEFADSAGHFRLLEAEKRWKQFPAPLGGELSPGKRTRVLEMARKGKAAGQIATRLQLSRGQVDLLVKLQAIKQGRE